MSYLCSIGGKIREKQTNRFDIFISLEIQIEKKLWLPFEKSSDNSLSVKANYLMFADICFTLL